MQLLRLIVGKTSVLRKIAGSRLVVPKSSSRSLATGQTMEKHSSASVATTMDLCELLNHEADGLSRAGELLRSGQCVAFPTETVYGLGANALDEQAVLNVFKYKGRPLTDPLIVHVPTAEEALRLLILAPAAHAVARALAASFWPGPLTIVGKAVPAIPLTVTAGTGFVGVRVPAHPIALGLLAAARVPVAAPSANRFGHVSPTTAAHVVADLGRCPIGVVVGEADHAAAAADADAGVSEGASTARGRTCAVGIESTVVKVDYAAPEDGEGSPGGPQEGGGGWDAASLSRVRLVVFRRGGVSVPQLEDACARATAALGHPGVRVPVEFRTLHSTAPLALQVPPGGAAGGATMTPPAAEARQSDGDAAPEVGAEAPGMLLTHYAPDVDTYLVASEAQSLAGESDAETARLPRPALGTAVIIDIGGTLAGFQGDALAYRDLSACGSVVEARARLFAALRWSEGVPGAKAVLLCDPLALLREGRATPEGSEHLDALRDRMYRAASGRHVTVASEGRSPI